MTVVEIAKKLISFDTSGPPTNELQLALWIKDFLSNLNIDSKLQEISENRANLVAKIAEGKGKGLLLSSHLDVVPAGEMNLWTVTSPYEPKVKVGKLYGRGACDMKGPMACILKALTDLDLNKLNRQLTVAFTAGEDTVGWHVKNLIDDGLVGPDDAQFGIIPEPSMMNIIHCHKADAEVKVLVHGKSAHSSRPEVGVNPISKSVNFLKELEIFQNQLAENNHPKLGSSTISPTLIKSGIELHIIPDFCEIDINMRLIPKHAKSDLIQSWLDNIYKKCKKEDPSFNAETVKVVFKNPLDMPEESGIVKILKNLLNKEPEGVPYYTEAVDYTRAGIPTVVCGPGSIDQAHTYNEFISLEQLNLGEEFFKNIIKLTCMNR
jgi:acetylornithine deacetylase/succinyl-diaminopimelate desuccinylase family protein